MSVHTLDKRKYKRKKIEKFLGSHLLDKNGEEHPVNVFDISENGMSIDILPGTDIKIKSGDTVAIRFYLTEDNYIHLESKVASVKELKAEECKRIGVSFRARGITDITMYHIVQLIEIMAHLTVQNAA